MKKTIFSSIVLLIIFSSLIPSSLFAGIDKDSIFWDARQPASILDLRLSKIENSWRRMFSRNPIEKIRKTFPLISSTRVLIALDYYNDDCITAFGWIMNTDKFLELSISERKRLAVRVLGAIRTQLYTKLRMLFGEDGVPNQIIENRNIKLSLIFNDIRENDQGQNINISLPLDIGSGVAGYKEGHFVFSKAYYLNLMVNKGVAKSGNPKQFIIENE